MPILLSIKQQNQHFSAQKQYTNLDMTTIDSFSKMLLTQNEALRLHYQQRSSDVRQLIQSLSINYNQNLSQIKHIAHTYKEHNCILSKNIQQVGEKISICEETIRKVSVELERCNGVKGRLEENYRERKVKNKIYERNMKKLEGKRDQKRMDQLEKQICDLHLDINILKKKNTMTLKLVKKQKLTLTAQKPEITNQAIQAIKSVKLLQTQLQKMEDDYRKYCEYKDELIGKQESLEKKEMDLYGGLESKKRMLNKLAIRKKELEINSKDLQTSIKVITAQKQKRQTQKAKLLQTLTNRKNNLATLQQSHNKQKQTINTQSTTKISLLKQELTKSQTYLSKTLINQLNPQLQQSQNTITHLNQDLEALEHEIQEMTNKLASIPNPIREIMRIQLQLKKINGRK